MLVHPTRDYYFAHNATRATALILFLVKFVATHRSAHASEALVTGKIFFAVDE